MYISGGSMTRGLIWGNWVKCLCLLTGFHAPIVVELMCMTIIYESSCTCRGARCRLVVALCHIELIMTATSWKEFNC